MRPLRRHIARAENDGRRTDQPDGEQKDRGEAIDREDPVATRRRRRHDERGTVAGNQNVNRRDT